MSEPWDERKWQKEVKEFQEKLNKQGGTKIAGRISLPDLKGTISLTGRQSKFLIATSPPPPPPPKPIEYDEYTPSQRAYRRHRY